MKNQKRSATYFGNETHATEYYAESGLYKIECWGAQGGHSLGGKGGYVAGYIHFHRARTLYIYVGGKGNGPNEEAAYNGGGHSQYGGGGASDVRIHGGSWDDFESLKSRIIVAAGGGGSDHQDPGGAGGGLIGFNSKTNRGHGGTQTAGGYGGPNGLFGKGGGNQLLDISGINDGNGAGGSGYFGGGGSNLKTSYGGGGGSSFISGYDGCNAIDKLSLDENHTIMTNQSIHYSKLRFFNIDMIDGNTSMPSPFGGNETGHSGFGVVRITFCYPHAITCYVCPQHLNTIFYIFIPLLSKTQ